MCKTGDRGPRCLLAVLALSLIAVLLATAGRIAVGSPQQGNYPGPGFGANTFTGLQTFSAGLTVSSPVNGIATAGQNITLISAFAATTPTTPVGSTNILASAPAGLYRATVYYVVTTAGVGGTAITVNVTYTDAQQAQTNSSITSSGLVLGQFAQGSLVLQQQAAGAIAYTVTETGTFSTHPVLALKVALERMQ